MHPMLFHNYQSYDVHRLHKIKFKIIIKRNNTQTLYIRHRRYTQDILGYSYFSNTKENVFSSYH